MFDNKFQMRQAIIIRLISLTLLVATLFSCQSQQPDMDIKNQFTHHVFFWLNNSGSAADRDKLIAGLRELERIEVINTTHIGIPADTEERGVVDNSYDVSLLLFFDNKEAQDTYQVHPVHLEFIEKNKDLWSKVVVYDTEASDR